MYISIHISINYVCLHNSVLNGNDLMCVCEIQWLVDLFESGVTLPDITGATCTDSNDISHDLESTNEIFTDCPG